MVRTRRGSGMAVEPIHRRQPVFQPALRRLAVVVPVGSFEQHGPHLPVHVDALLAGKVALRAGVKTASNHSI